MSRLRVFGGKLAIDPDFVEVVALLPVPAGVLASSEYLEIGLVRMQDQRDFYVEAEVVKDLLRTFSTAEINPVGADTSSGHQKYLNSEESAANTVTALPPTDLRKNNT